MFVKYDIHELFLAAGNVGSSWLWDNKYLAVKTGDHVRIKQVEDVDYIVKDGKQVVEVSFFNFNNKLYLPTDSFTATARVPVVIFRKDGRFAISLDDIDFNSEHYNVTKTVDMFEKASVPTPEGAILAPCLATVDSCSDDSGCNIHTPYAYFPDDLDTDSDESVDGTEDITEDCYDDDEVDDDDDEGSGVVKMAPVPAFFAKEKQVAEDTAKGVSAMDKEFGMEFEEDIPRIYEQFFSCVEKTHPSFIPTYVGLFKELGNMSDEDIEDEDKVCETIKTYCKKCECNK